MSWADARRDAAKMIAALERDIPTKGTRVALAWYESQTTLEEMDPANSWPLSYHQMVTRAVQRALLTKGAKVELVTVNVEGYKQWLGVRENTPALRALYLTNL